MHSIEVIENEFDDYEIKTKPSSNCKINTHFDFIGFHSLSL